MVVGSEVPNLLERGSAATLVVSQDIDVLVPLARHGSVREKEDDLAEARALFEELPSVARHTVRTNLGILALLPPGHGMPDPTPHRRRVAELLASLPEAT